MDKSQSEPILERERKNTDHSLSKERDKVNDESLLKERKTAERSTDKVVNEERQLADKAKADARDQADIDLKNDSNILSSDEKVAEDARHLQRDRQSTDKGTELERERIDDALEKERDIKNTLIARFLKGEREKTDKSLSLERTRADSEVDRGMILLSSEIANHLQTKTTLTTRNEFLAIVSHDLRNPIGAVSSSAGVLLEQSDQHSLSPETRELVELIKRNADTSLRLISNLLDMEQVAQGKLQFKFRRHDIAEIIQESIESYAHQASAKSIVLRFLPGDIHGEVLCDRDRILQVLSNLIGNAIKFTPKDGSVTVNSNFQDNEVQISVIDTGAGIPEDKIEHIFERFMQIGSNDRGSLGLGLYISRMLIEAHEGRLWVESVPGEGSTFFFTLPILN